MPRTVRTVSLHIGPVHGDLLDLAQKYCLVRDVLQQQQAAPAWEPPTDVYETPEAFVIQMELADVKPEEMELEVRADVLTIRGLRRVPQEAQSQRYHRREIKRGAFQKRILLGRGLDTSRIEASSANGILTIRIPKAAEAETHKIMIFRI